MGWALLLLALSLVWPTAHGIDRGRWCCTICGALEERLTFAGLTLTSRACEDSTETDVASSSNTSAWKRFERWFWSEIGEPHAHDWMPIGCHWNLTHDTVGCRISYGQAYFRALPSLPNPETATRMAWRVLRANPSERARLLRSAGLLPPIDLFGSLARGGSMCQADFDEAFAHWQSEHPEWR